MTVKLGMNATVSLGLIFIIIGALLVFPISIFPQNIIFVIIGLILIGASGAPINVPALILLGKIIKDTDSSLDEYTCNDISSAIYNFGTNIGDFCGPIFGGYISDKYGFKYSNIFTSILGIIITLIFSFYFRKEITNEYYDKTKYIKLNEENLLNKIDNDINDKETEQYNNNNNRDKIIMDIIDDK